jgi:hypothetical protein
MFASSEHAWDPMASSSVNFCRKTCTVPTKQVLELVQQSCNSLTKQGANVQTVPAHRQIRKVFGPHMSLLLPVLVGDGDAVGRKSASRSIPRRLCWWVMGLPKGGTQQACEAGSTTREVWWCVVCCERCGARGVVREVWCERCAARGVLRKGMMREVCCKRHDARGGLCAAICMMHEVCWWVLVCGDTQHMCSSIRPSNATTSAPPSQPRAKPASNHELCHHTDVVTLFHHA